MYNIVEILNKMTLFVQEDEVKLNILVTGGGSLLSLFTLIPGSSNVIEEIYSPYGYSSSRPIIGDSKPVSLEAAQAYLDRYPGENCVVVTAALSTNRVKKGKLEAFMGFRIKGKEEIFHGEFQPVSQEEFDKSDPQSIRFTMDYIITDIVLNYLLSGEMTATDVKKVK